MSFIRNRKDTTPAPGRLLDVPNGCVSKNANDFMHGSIQYDHPLSKVRNSYILEYIEELKMEVSKQGIEELVPTAPYPVSFLGQTFTSRVVLSADVLEKVLQKRKGRSAEENADACRRYKQKCAAKKSTRSETRS